MLLTRRNFMGAALGGAAMAAASNVALGQETNGQRPPNVILLMSDDQGYGDVGYYGHPVLKTPNLDAMAAAGLRFDNFYTSSPVCSPTRGSCLTGRHPYRYDITGANSGDYEDPSRMPLRDGEITLAELLKVAGYRTGHFGKWHLGDFDGPMRSSPADNGFDTSFSTVRKVPTVDPAYYFLDGEPYTEPLKGDDSAILMERALAFIEEAAEADQPFFAVIWFHAPHNPVLATEEYRAMYPDRSEAEQHFWGTITAMDAQVGRLRARLRSLEVAGNTMLWFCSDNGPAQGEGMVGTAGKLRAGKGSLYEGGVHVPAILEWPDFVAEPRVSQMRCSTLDYFPTVLEVLGIKLPDDRPYDGISLLPMIIEDVDQRARPIPFIHGEQVALIKGDFKLVGASGEASNGGGVELYNLATDPGETMNLADKDKAVASYMKGYLQAWLDTL